MPGDTKIKKVQNGWIDIDEPAKTYGARRLARDARRFRLQGRYAALAALSKTANNLAMPAPGSKTPTPVPAPSLTGLQQKLFDRMTKQQGVTAVEALDMIKNNGYNKAASYGHIRAAGATHSEAFLVVNIGLPAVSLSYGTSRANGEDHTSALRKALSYDDD
jgi:hypothetical protein